jgi:MoxR-like ATPase
VLEKVVVADPIRDYACRIVLATHPDIDSPPEQVARYVRWGASPRASQALVMAGRVRALAAGRAHVSFGDIRSFADEVLQHRILLNYDGQAENIRVTDLIAQILDEIPEETA